MVVLAGCNGQHGGRACFVGRYAWEQCSWTPSSWVEVGDAAGTAARCRCTRAGQHSSWLAAAAQRWRAATGLPWLDMRPQAPAYQPPAVGLCCLPAPSRPAAGAAAAAAHALTPSPRMTTWLRRTTIGLSMRYRPAGRYTTPPSSLSWAASTAACAAAAVGRQEDGSRPGHQQLLRPAQWAALLACKPDAAWRTALHAAANSTKHSWNSG